MWAPIRKTRTYMTRILVPNPEHRLRLGMVAKAGIDVGEQMEAMVLPATAIVRTPGKSRWYTSISG